VAACAPPGDPRATMPLCGCFFFDIEVLAGVQLFNRGAFEGSVFALANFDRRRKLLRSIASLLVGSTLSAGPITTLHPGVARSSPFYIGNVLAIGTFADHMSLC